MKSVLMSIKPKYCELIANGKKTIEVRKTKPKLDTPFKCYIYCTQDFANFTTKTKRSEMWIGEPINSVSKGRYLGNGKVIGEFVCNDIIKLTAEFTDGKTYEDIRYCYLDVYEEEQEMILVSNEWDNPNDSWICKESCLSFDNFKKYIGENFHDIPFYGWQITDLKIYDKPKELGEFTKFGALSYDDWLYGLYNGKEASSYENYLTPFKVTRPPQSWCYVEELRE